MLKYPMSEAKNQSLANALESAEENGDYRGLQNAFDARNDRGEWVTDEDRRLCGWVEMALRYPFYGLQTA